MGANQKRLRYFKNVQNSFRIDSFDIIIHFKIDGDNAL